MDVVRQALEDAIKNLKKDNWYFESDGLYTRVIYNNKCIELCEQALRELN